MKTEEIETRLGKKLFDSQLDCITELGGQETPKPRMCIYVPTGKGKTVASLASLASLGHKQAVVIAPPATKKQWVPMAAKLGLSIDVISHAKFRMKSTRMQRDVPVIADEFHLFGGHTGQGWKKLAGLAGGLQAPLVLASATPNYNDAERVYCIQYILDPVSCRGGFLEFLYRHCETEQNPFSVTPNVLGFRNYASAAEYLADLDRVVYLPDTLIYDIEDLEVAEKISHEFSDFGYNRRGHKMIGSQIEEKHARINLSLLDDDGLLHEDVLDALTQLVHRQGPALLFCNHSTIAEAVAKTFDRYKVASYSLVTGKTSDRKKHQAMEDFIAGGHQVLIATATLATGPDGMDKMCDKLIILDDTEDDSLRRQLIGRIMPRGEDDDASMKRVVRLVIA